MIEAGGRIAGEDSVGCLQKRALGSARVSTHRSPRRRGRHRAHADLSDLPGVVELADQVSRDFGDVDILVHNLGGSDADTDAVGGFLDTDDRLWGRSFDRNVFAAVRTSRAMLPGEGPMPTPPPSPR